MRVTITNTFHNTEARVNVRPGVPMSESVARRVRRTLCGMSDCRCGDFNRPHAQYRISGSDIEPTVRSWIIADGHEWSLSFEVRQ